MKLVIIILLGLHGLIHLIGFTQAFDLVSQNSKSVKISKFHGILWFISTISFIAVAFLLFIRSELWWIISFPAVALSQILILTYWKQARAGSIANLILILIALTGYAHWNFKGKFKTDVDHYLSTQSIESSLLTDQDLTTLPYPVQQYIRQSGSIGKPKVKNYSIVFNGQIRKNEESDWMPFQSEQYNFNKEAVRLFYMEATMFGLPVSGYHRYINGDASMDIRLLSTFRVQYETGPEMGIAETVTFFNDMCTMAPATLIDNRIEWLEADSLQVKARFTNNKISIIAWLHFNQQYELVNFVSDDRYALEAVGKMKKQRWSTPLTNIQEISGVRLVTSAEAIYHYPDKNLIYGTFHLIKLSYNVLPKAIDPENP